MKQSKIYLIASLLFFILLLFEIVVFTDIITHPYMVMLCLILGCAGGYNLGSSISLASRGK